MCFHLLQLNGSCFQVSCRHFDKGYFDCENIPGGLLVTSYTTLDTPSTSFTILRAIAFISLKSNSYGSALIKSVLVTARRMMMNPEGQCQFRGY